MVIRCSREFLVAAKKSVQHRLLSRAFSWEASYARHSSHDRVNLLLPYNFSQLTFILLAGEVFDLIILTLKISGVKNVV